MPNQFQFAEAYTELTLRGRNKFHADIRGVTASLKTLQTHFEGVARHARRMLLVGGGALAAMVKFASDAAEAQSKFNAVFRENADSVRAWTRELGAAVGRSKFAIENTMSSFQAFFVGMGFGSQQAIELSKKMQRLAIDFASFHNLADAEASQRFISALSGSSEVLDMFGINIKQAALEQELYAMGVQKSVMAASEQEKTLARVSVIFRAMGQQGAIGDAVRTSGQLANQMRMLKDRFMEVSVEIGNAFIPLVQRAITALAEMLKGMQNMDSATKESIVRWVLLIGSLAGFLAIAPKLIGSVRAFGAAMLFLSGTVGAGSLLAGGIGLLVLALGGLGAAFLAAKAKGESFGEFLDRLATSIHGAQSHADKLAQDLDRIKSRKTPIAEVSSGKRVVAEPTTVSGKRAQALAASEKNEEDLRTRLTNAAAELAKVRTDWIEERERVSGGHAPPTKEGKLPPRTTTAFANPLWEVDDRNLTRHLAALDAVNTLQAEIDAAQITTAERRKAMLVDQEARPVAEQYVKQFTESLLERLSPGLPFQVRTAKAGEEPVKEAVRQRIGKELIDVLFSRLPPDLRAQKELEDRRIAQDAAEGLGDVARDMWKNMTDAERAGTRARERGGRDTQTMGMAGVNRFLQQAVTKTEDQKLHALVREETEQVKQVVVAVKQINPGWA